MGCGCGPEACCSCFFGAKAGGGVLSARLRHVPREPLVTLLDVGSAFVVTFWIMCKLETLITCTTAVMSTLLYWWYAEHLSINLSWTLVSFAVVFPLTMALRQAFGRRETALATLARFRGQAVNVLCAHMYWDWFGTNDYVGRQEGKSKADHAAYPVTNEHMMQVHKLLQRVLNALEAYLLLPRSLRARTMYCGPCGDAEREEVEGLETEAAIGIETLLGRLHGATETLKRGGLPGNEGSRINQYLMFLSRDWEQLRALKQYRTPQAMRSFSRVMIHTLPTFYGPYFIYVAKTDSRSDSAVGFACVFAVLISLFLTGLFLVENVLENPFGIKSLDTVRVQRDIDGLRKHLRRVMDDYLQSRPWNADDELAMKWDDTAIVGRESGLVHVTDRTLTDRTPGSPG
eukprot:Hpha_TRINITY_DN31539_c0_g1::TRINITY_DN31539_c0_g1_i1::g.1606::m.1606